MDTGETNAYVLCHLESAKIAPVLVQYDERGAAWQYPARTRSVRLAPSGSGLVIAMTDYGKGRNTHAHGHGKPPHGSESSSGMDRPNSDASLTTRRFLRKTAT